MSTQKPFMSKFVTRKGRCQKKGNHKTEEHKKKLLAFVKECEKGVSGTFMRASIGLTSGGKIKSREGLVKFCNRAGFIGVIKSFRGLEIIQKLKPCKQNTQEQRGSVG